MKTAKGNLYLENSRVARGKGGPENFERLRSFVKRMWKKERIGGRERNRDGQTDGAKV